MIHISNTISIKDYEYTLSTMSSQGPGGQNVNKVATAVHLRFDIKNSSLPQFYKDKLLSISDQRITKDGIIVIKAQATRSQIKNKIDAIDRLQKLIINAVKEKKKRVPTRVSKATRERRLDKKTKKSKIKLLRKKVEPNFD